jgi:hypothetical protein
VPRVVKAQDLAGMLRELLQPALERMLLFAVLMVGSEEREYVASYSPISGLDTRYGIRPNTRGYCDRSWLNVNLLWITFPLRVSSRHIQKLLGVCPGSLAKLTRKTGQTALVLHVEEQLRRAIRVGCHNYLLSGVRMLLQVSRALRPAGMACVYLETSSIQRHKVVDFVQLVNLSAEFLR